ncbi:glycosyltransferase family 2 protein [Microbacterium sp. USHLN186]|uniref:glycosyltransferase family 2 protein n=1 Tax=Microbacterium sp. USHLN186 TaxID=3081286 RepID=UPI003018E45E
MSTPAASARRRSRRGAAHWAVPADPPPAAVDVLIPTAGRSAELAVTLAGLAAQDDPAFRVVISDQSHGTPGTDAPAVQAMIRVLGAQGRAVQVHRHLPRRGMAEQRQFLLDQASAPRVLFLDDDVWLEPGALQRLHEALSEQRCGLVGYAVQGLSYLDDDRPEERHAFSGWHGRVEAETVRRGSPAFERWPLHNAANVAHQAAVLGLDDDARLAYRIAWCGGCVLFERDALLAVGGFEFWSRLPPQHAGEDVVAQWRVMERFGGAGILPSAAVHLEAPTTIVDRRVEAREVLLDPDGTSPGPSGIGTQEKGSSHERQAQSDPDPEVPGRHRLPREQGRHHRIRA